ncbi:hypothetical protein [Moheibacter sediminis]|uniref:Uncharacterized protein n=1 Tax=Moheibacter sediminis TaxID=1434700 RepID=A0A1W2C3N3_9FLAO|nr:hypothetical protein [Moheibacter sediminis]SMC79512.1 hypothetical protein SAMN06296427_10894 [Moheibacter sediminis]
MGISIFKSIASLLLIGSFFINLNAQVGINLGNPESMLDIQGNSSVPPLKIQNLTPKSVSQPIMLLVDEDDNIVSSIKRYYPIVYASVTSLTGLNLPYTANNTLYELNNPTTGFTIVNDLTTNIVIDNQRGDNNVINIDLSGVAQFDSNTAIATNVYFDYEIGIFVNNQLKEIRRFSLAGDGYAGSFIPFGLKGVVGDLADGNYEIKVGFLSKSSNAAIPLSIGKASTAFLSNYLKNDIVSLRLHVYGVYF